MHVKAIFDRSQAQFIRLSDHLAAFDAAAGHPHRKPGRIMIAAIALLAHRRPAKFSAPQHERGFEQAARFQIPEQTRDRFIDCTAKLGMILLDPRMRVPLASRSAIKLHETNAMLDQSARQQTVPAKTCRMVVIQTVKPFRCFSFFAEVNGLRRLGLHPESQFVTPDSGIQFSVFWPCRGTIPIELREQFHLAALLGFADAAWRIQIRKRFHRRAQPHALIKRGHETRSPIARTADHLAVIVAEHRERGQVLILGAKPIADPCAEGRPPTEDRASVHLADTVGMVQSVTPARPNHREVIDTFCHVRQPVRNPDAALAVLLPFPAIRQQWRFRFTHRRNDRTKTFRQTLSRHFPQFWFWIECIEVAGPAFHEQENDAFCFGRKMCRLCRQRIRDRDRPGSQALPLEQISQCQCPKSRAGAGFGALALTYLLERESLTAGPVPIANPLAAKPAHFPAKAKSVIFLFMEGGPSHLDTFDPKPKLREMAGQRLPESFGPIITAMGESESPLLADKRAWKQHGQSGAWVSDWLPHIAECVDDLAIIRSCCGDGLNHANGVGQMNTGSILGGRPSLGAWVSYGLGTENQNLPAFTVLCDNNGQIHGGPRNWGQGFMPAIYQGVRLGPATEPFPNLNPPRGISEDQQIGRAHV